MLFQGNPDVCSAINAHLEKILNRLQDGDNALDIVEETKIKPKKTMTAKSGKRSGMKISPKNVNLALSLSFILSRRRIKK